MFFDILSEGLTNGFFWLPFVLGVGLLYKNMKIIDVSIDGIVIVSVIAFVSVWNRTDIYFIAMACATGIGVICYLILSFCIFDLKINAIFAGIIFTLILHAVSVLLIGESWPIRTADNYEKFNGMSEVMPFIFFVFLIIIEFFLRTPDGIAIRVAANEKANTPKKRRSLLLGFALSGFIVGYGAHGYAIREAVARSGGGFDFVITSLTSFLLMDKIIDFFISKWKSKNEEKIIKRYYLLSVLESVTVKALLGSILFQILVLFIIAYTPNPVYWKLIFGVALLITVSNNFIVEFGQALYKFYKKTEENYNSVANRRKKPNKNAKIIVENVGFSYDTGYESKVIFSHLYADFDAGINIIRGENGVGKTTLLNLINKEIAPKTGKITIVRSDQQISLSGEERRHPIFYLRQDVISIFVKELTVYENVISIIPKGYGKGWLPIMGVKRLMKDVQQIIDGYGLTFDFLNDKSIWVKRIDQLSGGQIQKIAYLMALVSDCDIILADEPSSGLDEENVEVLKEFFQKLSEKGKIIIIVSHDSRLYDWNIKYKDFYMSEVCGGKTQKQNKGQQITTRMVDTGKWHKNDSISKTTSGKANHKK